VVWLENWRSRNLFYIIQKFFLLDEPTIGLDPIARRSVWEILEKLKANYDVTTLMSTHYMEEAEMLCDRLAIMDRGHIVAIGSPKELMEKNRNQQS